MSEESSSTSFPAQQGAPAFTNLAALAGARAGRTFDPEGSGEISPSFQAPVVSLIRPPIGGTGNIVIQPAFITAGAPSILMVYGPELSPVPYGYAIVGSTGPVNATFQILSFSPDRSQATLSVFVPGNTPGGSYNLVVQQTRTVPLQILSGVPAVPRVDSVQPFQIPIGVSTALTITGLNLPAADYFIAGPGPVTASFFSLSLSPDQRTARVQVFIPDQPLRNGAYSLFARNGSQSAPVLLFYPGSGF